ncbi:MAG: hypothetical protein KAR79_00530 [Simkaniaceae bacterium]|nr:hypothetical protein [Simkaniaceae bacterium]
MVNNITKPAQAVARPLTPVSTPKKGKGANRGDAFGYLMALMMSKTLGADSNLSKAQRKQEAENFLKQSIETAMRKISSFGQLKIWLNQMVQDSKGYSPAMQAWMKNMASQMNNFSDSKGEKAITKAQTALNTDFKVLQEDQKSLNECKDDIRGCNKEIADTKKNFVNGLLKPYRLEIARLEREKAHTKSPFKKAALDIEIAAVWTAEKAALPAIYTAEGAKLAALYSARGIDTNQLSDFQEDVKLDQSKVNKDQKNLNIAEYNIRSEKTNLKDRLENRGKKLGSEAKSGLTQEEVSYHKRQQIEENFAMIIGAVSTNSAQPREKPHS